MALLSDKKITELVYNGKLIKNYVEANIGPASYELRLSKYYFDLTESNKLQDAEQFGNILIKPGHRVVLMTEEEVSIPIDVAARVISKGSMFSIGLTPVCTNADPGFEGRLGIVTQNMSDKYIRLDIGESIAKIEFSLLEEEATKKYDGPHGFKLETWPIRDHMQFGHSDLYKDPRVKSEFDEAKLVLPSAISLKISEIENKQRKFQVILFVLFLILSLSFVGLNTGHLDFFSAIAVNLISTLLAYFSNIFMR